MEEVKKLYKLNLDEVIDQCLARVAPNTKTVTLKSVKMGLGVNKATHTDVTRRRANEVLYEEIATLGGQMDAHVEKQQFKNWVHGCLEKRDQSRSMKEKEQVVNSSSSPRKIGSN